MQYGVDASKVKGKEQDSMVDMMELTMESSKRFRVQKATETETGREDQGKEAETNSKETRQDTDHGQGINPGLKELVR